MRIPNQVIIIVCYMFSGGFMTAGIISALSSNNMLLTVGLIIMGPLAQAPAFGAWERLLKGES